MENNKGNSILNEDTEVTSLLEDGHKEEMIQVLIYSANLMQNEE